MVIICGRSVIPRSRTFHELQNKYDAHALIIDSLGGRVIWPGQQAHVFFEWKEQAAITPMMWGFTPEHWMYNARSDSMHKPTWRGPFAHTRCVIPVKTFHEGKKDFAQKEKATLYVAGMYGLLAGTGTMSSDKFVFTMLTTKATPTVFPFHHRQPLLMGEQHLLDWCNPKAPAQDILEHLEIFTADYELEVAA